MAYESFYKVGDLMKLLPRYADSPRLRAYADSLVVITKIVDPSNFRGRSFSDPDEPERSFYEGYFKRVSMVPVPKDSQYRDIYERYYLENADTQ